MRVSGRWIQALGTVTTHREVFARRENLICFHNHFLFSIAGYCRGAKCTPHQLAFAVQKLSEQRTANECQRLRCPFQWPSYLASDRAR